MSKVDVIYIFWSCRDKIEAKKIVGKLLEERIVACASMIPEVESIYRWEEVIEESFEVKVILKTISKHFEKVCAVIQSMCSYKVPEIVQIDVVRGNPSYLSWIKTETD